MTTSWRILPDESDEAGHPILVKAKDINITATGYWYETDICIPGMPGAPGSYIEYQYITDKVMDGGMKYKGTLFYNAWHVSMYTEWVFRVETKQIYPFFFEAFNITEWCD